MTSLLASPPLIKVIIPAFNEADSIAHVIQDIPDSVSEIVVVNNNSTDNTVENAQNAGATVLTETKKGYGYACLCGMDYDKVVAPIIEDKIDMVIGARVKDLREEGSMTPQQIFGNWLATSLMKLFFRATFTDLGPFRAMKYDKLLALQMQDKTYGWTVEMQLKALKQKYTYTEVPVRYKKRIGVSKVSGTVKGSIFAGIKILGWIFKYSLK